jgi:hypothetical protein
VACVPEKYVKNTETTRGILSSLFSARKVRLGEIKRESPECHGSARCSSVIASFYPLSRARARAYSQAFSQPGIPSRRLYTPTTSRSLTYHACRFASQPGTSAEESGAGGEEESEGGRQRERKWPARGHDSDTSVHT